MSKPHQAFALYPGKYYVQYFPNSMHPKPHRSMCMQKGTAKKYADIFGGTVHRDPAFPTITETLISWIDKFRALN
jgi:hypothetical protein